MEIDILTLFPGICAGPLGQSILKRAHERGLVGIRIHDIREWCTDKHRQADDYPFGGGAGMVMKPQPVFAAIEAVRGMHVLADLVAQDLHGETRLVAVEVGAVYQQPGRLVDGDQVRVAVDDVQRVVAHPARRPGRSMNCPST